MTSHSILLQIAILFLLLACPGEQKKSSDSDLDSVKLQLAYAKGAGPLHVTCVIGMSNPLANPFCITTIIVDGQLRQHIARTSIGEASPIPVSPFLDRAPGRKATVRIK